MKSAVKGGQAFENGDEADSEFYLRQFKDPQSERLGYRFLINKLIILLVTILVLNGTSLSICIRHEAEESWKAILNNFLPLLKKFVSLLMALIFIELLKK